MTAKYKKKALLFFLLSISCLFGPILFFFLRAFVCGDAGEEFRGLTEEEVRYVIDQIERREKRDEEITERAG